MNIYAQYEAPSGNGLFLKIDDGKSVKLRFASEPYIFQNGFTDKATGQTNYSTRYAWVVYNRDEKKAQIFQQGVTGYKNLANLANDTEWGDPINYDIRVTRSGTGTDTKYHMTPAPVKSFLTVEEKAEVAKIDVVAAIPNAISLERVVAGEALPEANDPKDDQPPTTSYDPENDAPVNLDDIPFS